MAKNSTEIVPFGKYKGKPLDVLLQDHQYLIWLQTQPWFRNKYKSLYNIVVLGNSDKDQPTPDHNKLQAKFLDKTFLYNLFRSITPKYGRLSEYATINCTFEPNSGMDIDMKVCFDRDALKKRMEEIIGTSVSQLEEQLFSGKIYSFTKAEQILSNYLDKFDDFILPNFGLSQDIEKNITIHISFCSLQYKIELKTSLGDDYPCVLRKMKRQMQMIKERRYGCCRYNKIILLVDQFESEAITKEQLVQIFKNENIEVMFFDEIIE